NGALHERVRELKARLGQTSADSSRPPSSDPPEAPARVLRHALAVGAEMDRKSRGNKLDRAEGALTDDTEFRPLYAWDRDHRSQSRPALGTDHRLLGKDGPRIAGG